MPFAESEYETLEGLESEFESEAAGRPKVRMPSRQPSFKPRPAPTTPMYVTQPQLEAALTRVDGKVKTVADGVSTINTRINSLSASMKKEAEERKKALEGQSKDLNQKLQLLALLPLLVTSPTATLSTALPTVGGGSVTTISTPDTNNLDSLLPLLLVSGLGGAGGGGFGLGGDGSGSDGSLLILALVLAFANKS